MAVGMGMCFCVSLLLLSLCSVIECMSIVCMCLCACYLCVYTSGCVVHVCASVCEVGLVFVLPGCNFRPSLSSPLPFPVRGRVLDLAMGQQWRILQ